MLPQREPEAGNVYLLVDAMSLEGVSEEQPPAPRQKRPQPPRGQRTWMSG
jgi:hypothetical protein